MRHTDISEEHLALSARERQILEVLYRKGEATGRQVREGIANPPGYSAVRATLRILERKGSVRHKEQGLKYVYFPAVEREPARRSALHRLVRTYFDDSIEEVVRTILNVFSARVTHEELDRLAKLLKAAKRDRRALVAPKC